MASSRKKKNDGPSLRQEVAGVIAIVFSLFLFFCLFSFTIPNVEKEAASVANWGGPIGYLIASLLMSFLGLSSFWLPALLIVFGVLSFSSSLATSRIPFVVAGATGLLVASSSLLSSAGNTTVTFFGKTYPLGGNLGDFIFGKAAAYLGTPGAVLIFLAVFLLSSMAALRFSPYSWSRQCLDTYKDVNKKIKQQRINTKNRKNEKTKVLPENHPEQSLTLPRVHEPIHLKPEDEVKEFQPLPVSSGDYMLPSTTLLDKPEGREIQVDKDHYLEISRRLESTLLDFGVEGKVTGISPGPVITTYEFAPAPGVKINKVVSLADDLALVLKTESVRIVGSIPGKAALGIEIPNPERKVVHIRDIIATEQFQKAKSKLTLGLGMDIVGRPVLADLSRMPHLLIAGATGAGKSVAINSIICSLLFKASPEEVRLLMVDPKRIELSSYEAIPHLLHPVVVDPKMASRALIWAVKEMERRYGLMEEMRVKSFASYNDTAEEKLPYIVVIIDELADLMMVSSNEVETSLARLAQMARAAGMHLILATQRPSVDVLTGLIKANFPTRMSFKVSSKIDSRTILDTSGAEHLLGAGDMLFLPPGAARLQRIHGAYISEQESERIVSFLKKQGTAQYDEVILQSVEKEPGNEDLDGEEYDEKYDEAVSVVCESGQASISMVQRRLRVGYNRAARMIEVMEKEGIIGPADGAKPREVLVRKEY
jgi:DNA segregation ATPase FtsK/SpoIIIE, S-DNA-T family